MAPVIERLQYAKEVTQKTEADTEILKGFLALDNTYSQDPDYETSLKRWNKDADKLRSNVLKRKGLSGRVTKKIGQDFDRERLRYERNISTYTRGRQKEAGRAAYFRDLEMIKEAVRQGVVEPRLAIAKGKSKTAQNISALYLRADEAQLGFQRFTKEIEAAGQENIYSQALLEIQKDPSNAETILKAYEDKLDARTRAGLMQEARVLTRFNREKGLWQRKEVEDQAETDAWQVAFTEKDMSWDWLRQNQHRLAPGVLNSYTNMLVAKEKEEAKYAELKDPVNRKIYLEVQQGAITQGEQIDEYVKNELITIEEAKTRKAELADRNKVFYDIKAEVLDMIDNVRQGTGSPEKVKEKLVQLAAMGGAGQAKAEEYRKRLSSAISAPRDPADPLNRPIVKRSMDTLSYLKTAQAFAGKDKRRNIITWMEISNDFADWVTKNPEATDEQIETKLQKMIEPDIALGFFYKVFTGKKVERERIAEIRQRITNLPDTVFRQWQKAKTEGVGPEKFLKEWESKKKRLNVDIAADYLRKANGDRKIAEQMAADDGYYE